MGRTKIADHPLLSLSYPVSLSLSIPCLFACVGRYGRSKGTVQKEGQIVRLRAELDDLRKRLEKERGRLHQEAMRAGHSAASLGLNTRATPATEGPSGDEAGLLALAEGFSVTHHFDLDAEEAAYRLLVEIPLPIDCVVLSGDIPLDLLDTEHHSAIVSVTNPDIFTPPMPQAPAAGAGEVSPVAYPRNPRIVATYRCQERTSRLEMRIRTVEGQYGTVRATVVAHMTPKTAEEVEIQVRPLSLHHRVQSDPDDRPMGELRVQGSFSLNLIHEWIAALLPEVPARCAIQCEGKEGNGGERLANSTISRLYCAQGGGGRSSGGCGGRWGAARHLSAGVPQRPAWQSARGRIPKRPRRLHVGLGVRAGHREGVHC